MKHLNIMSTLLAVLACASCGDNGKIDEPEKAQMNFSETEVAISADAGQATLTFTSDTPWKISSTPDWLGYVKPSSGDAGTFELTVSGRFYDGPSKREGTVTATAGSSQASFKVIQYGPVHAVLSPSSVENLPNGDGTFEVEIDADFSYDIVLPDSGWITRQSTSLPQKGSIVFAFQANGSEPRSACVLFRDPVTGFHVELPVSQQGSVSYLERKALEDLFNSTAGDSWTHKDNWMSDKPLSQWYGVRTASNGRVEGLDLSSNNLTGSIGDSFVSLSALKELKLSGNKLSGSLPHDIRLLPGWNGFNAAVEIYAQQPGYGFSTSDGEVSRYQAATRGKGLDIVFVGDAFNSDGLVLGKGFDALVERGIKAIFAIDPMTAERERFNIYSVSARSEQTTISTSPGKTAFGTYFTSGLGVTMTTDWEKVFSYVGKAPVTDIKNTLIVLLVNTDRFGGCTLGWDDGSRISIIPDYPAGTENKYGFDGLVMHEAVGHGLGRLDEEYHYSNETAPSDFPSWLASRQNTGVSLNISASPDPMEVPWHELIGNPDYPSVGVFEGAYLYTYGAYRSEQFCCMDDNRPYFSAWCRYLIRSRIRKLSGESYSLADFIAEKG